LETSHRGIGVDTPEDARVVEKLILGASKN